MNDHLRRCYRARVLLIGLACFAADRAQVSGEEPVAAAERELPAHRIVVRLSDEMLNSLMNKPFGREVDVRDVILGTSIHGKATISAAPGVQLKECPDQATFQVVVNGTAQSRSTGYNGPAIIHSRSVTSFVATRQVVFDPGRGFYTLPPQVQARTQTFIDRIDSTRRGIAGRIVRRRAAREASARHAEATEIARQKTEQRIALAFDRHMEERLARLNWVANFRQMAVAALRPAESGEPKYACCSTPHYLQIATNFGNGGPAIALPTAGAVSAKKAPIEVWVHGSLVQGKLAVALKLLNTRSRASDFLTAISATAKVLDGQTNRGNPSLLAQPPVNIRYLEDWIVVEVDLPTDERLAAAPRRL
jgi:hypothetical protein